MDKILSKKDYLLYKEAAVHWNDSILKSATKALFSPLSWLKGSIKKGLKKQQIKGLISQWEIEYMNAIKKVDLNTKSSEEENTEDENTEGENELNLKISEEDKTKLLSELNIEFDNIKTIHEVLSDLYTVTTIDDKLFNDSKNKITNKKINLDLFDDLYVNYKINLKIDYQIYDDPISVINQFITDLHLASHKSAKDFIKDSTKGDPKKYLEIKKSNCDKLYKLYSSIIDKINNIKPTSDDDSDDDTNESMAYNIILNEFYSNYTINEAGLLKKAVAKVRQAKDDLVSEMFPEEYMEKALSIPNIKELTKNNLNYIRLNQIKYEANYIIENSKNGDKDQGPELKKMFDLGIFNINDYFQDVIDIDNVNNKVTGKVDQQTQDNISSQYASVNDLQNMGITEVFTDSKFDKRKFYAFNGLFTGQIGKSSTVTIIMSPIDDYIIDNKGQKHFMFKLFGSYKYDKKTKKTIRINPFEILTSSTKIKNNFKDKEYSYYIALNNLRPGKSLPVFIYSNKGGFFMNDEIDTVENKKNDIINKTKNAKNSDEKIKSLTDEKSNIFKFKINQRFILSDDIIKNNKFPGLQLNDAKSSNNDIKARTNHENLMKIIY